MYQLILAAKLHQALIQTPRKVFLRILNHLAIHPSELFQQHSSLQHVPVFARG